MAAADRARFGDLVITDPRMMRALAHPARLAILDILRRDGPASATELAPRIGVTPSAASWHLRHLHRFGLIRDGDPHPDGRARRWQAAVPGFRFDVPADPADTEGRTAARTLIRGLMVTSQAAPARWLADVEPDLDPAWTRAAGFSDTRVVVDAGELETILDRIEDIVAPYVTRSAVERPAGARGVRILRYALPEAEDAAVDGAS